MGLQLIVECADPAEVERHLGVVASQCEWFLVAPGQFGISIPTRLVDAIGEDAIWESLRPLRSFDLYEGAWRPAG